MLSLFYLVTSHVDKTTNLFSPVERYNNHEPYMLENAVEGHLLF